MLHLELKCVQKYLKRVDLLYFTLNARVYHAKVVYQIMRKEKEKKVLYPFQSILIWLIEVQIIFFWKVYFSHDTCLHDNHSKYDFFY